MHKTKRNPERNITHLCLGLIDILEVLFIKIFKEKIRLTI